MHSINANAGIEGTVKGELKVLKQDKDTKAPIANVKFKLKRWISCKGQSKRN